MGAFDNLRGDQIDHGCESLLIFSACASSFSITPTRIRLSPTILYPLVPLLPPVRCSRFPSLPYSVSLLTPVLVADNRLGTSYRNDRLVRNKLLPLTIHCRIRKFPNELPINFPRSIWLILYPNPRNPITVRIMFPRT